MKKSKNYDKFINGCIESLSKAFSIPVSVIKIEFANKKQRKRNYKTHNEKKLYEYLKTQFSDLKSCKKWFKKWLNSDQPAILNTCFSMRALATHCSNVLEGKEKDNSGNELLTCYVNTKYGSDILWS